MSRLERNAKIYEENARYERHPEAERPSAHRPVFGWVIKCFGILLIFFTILACISLAIPKILGMDSFIVVSGSMEPSVPVGSIVYSREADPAQIEVGEIIVFIDPSRSTAPITHRVVENDPDRGYIITKGDANAHNDVNPVTYDNVIGKAVFHLPFVGYLASPFATVMGKAAVAMFILGGWLLTEIGNRLIRIKKRQNVNS